MDQTEKRSFGIFFRCLLQLSTTSSTVRRGGMMDIAELLKSVKEHQRVEEERSPILKRLTDKRDRASYLLGQTLSCLQVTASVIYRSKELSEKGDHDPTILPKRENSGEHEVRRAIAKLFVISARLAVLFRIEDYELVTLIRPASRS